MKRPSLLRKLAILCFATVLTACSTIEPFGPAGTTDDGRALFEASAKAHGKSAFEQLTDINVSFDSYWYTLVTLVQPELVDEQYRNGSEERIVLRTGLHAQEHNGEAGKKWVLRQWLTKEAGGPPSVAIERNDNPDEAPVSRAAAAIVADAYRLFLLGPLNFLDRDARFRALAPVQLNGRLTDRLLIRTEPGLGLSDADRYVLFIDREDRLTRRVWFSLDGMESTRGAIVETNMSEYKEIAGVKWPTQFYERIRNPMPYLPAHRWSLTGLDVNRGLSRDDFASGGFSVRAARPAALIE